MRTLTLFHQPQTGRSHPIVSPRRQRVAVSGQVAPRTDDGTVRNAWGVDQTGRRVNRSTGGCPPVAVDRFGRLFVEETKVMSSSMSLPVSSINDPSGRKAEHVGQLMPCSAPFFRTHKSSVKASPSWNNSMNHDTSSQHRYCKFRIRSLQQCPAAFGRGLRCHAVPSSFKGLLVLDPASYPGPAQQPVPVKTLTGHHCHWSTHSPGPTPRPKWPDTAHHHRFTRWTPTKTGHTAGEYSGGLWCPDSRVRGGHWSG